MMKKLTALMMVLCLLTMGTAACGAGEDPETQQSSQVRNVYETMDDEQMMKEVQKMKDEGILDENGQPMPGVDLNDYPGRG